MSTTLRIGYLRFLQKIGLSSIKAMSVFKLPYRISLGDYFSENPYFNPVSNVGEIVACAAWVIHQPSPVVYDVGAHCGFIATQLAGILRDNKPTIYAFEPVPPTYHELQAAIHQLQLDPMIRPMQTALGDSEGRIRIQYSKWESMLAQVQVEEAAGRTLGEVYDVEVTTLDKVCTGWGVPAVIKIDVEGWEVPVLRGARNAIRNGLLNHTAWCLEWNPEALSQTGHRKEELFEELMNHRFYYINDYEGQKRELLERVEDPRTIGHVCNLFAIPGPSTRDEEWKLKYRDLMSKYRVKVN